MVEIYIGNGQPNNVTGFYGLMEGKGGNDTLTSTFGGFVKLYGGNGNDYLDHRDGVGGYADIFGGAGDDVIDGGDGIDLLYGQSGNDTIKGKKGNDSLYGGNGKDKLYGGGGHDDLYGGKGNDKLFGNKGADYLNGGRGKDKLTGGAGPDVFAFTEPPGKKHADVIKDFAPGVDLIELWTVYFPGPEGFLPAGWFRQGKNAKDGNDRVIYDKSSGKLFWDPDGKGGVEKQLFAKLKGKPDIDHTDFYLIT